MNNKHVYIFGLGESGLSAAKYFYKRGFNYYAWDDNAGVRKNSYLTIKKNLLKNIKEIKEQDISMVIVSPGIRIDHPLLKKFYKMNVPLYRDLEIFSQNVDKKNVIAVTGTNGKSTTVSMIGQMIRQNTKKVFVGGNLRPPLLDALDSRKYDKYVVELSSYQLESCPTFDSYISLLLNINEDHSDRYKNITHYAKIKKKIFQNLKKDNYGIIGIDNLISKNIFSRIKNFHNNLIPISTKRRINKGVSILDSKIIDNYFGKNYLDLNNIKTFIKQKHNEQNILALYVVAKILGYKEEEMIKTIKNFKGLKHRKQIIYKSNNLIVVNDSKATNLSSAVQSINSYSSIHLIMGGVLKHKDFNELLILKEKINKIYLIGEASNYIYNTLKNFIECQKCNTMKTAVKNCIKDVKKYKTLSTILLAPAGSSFDQYMNFEERGDDFINICLSELKNE